MQNCGNAAATACCAASKRWINSCADTWSGTPMALLAASTASLMHTKAPAASDSIKRTAPRSKSTAECAQPQFPLAASSKYLRDACSLCFALYTHPKAALCKADSCDFKGASIDSQREESGSLWQVLCTKESISNASSSIAARSSGSAAKGSPISCDLLFAVSTTSANKSKDQAIADPTRDDSRRCIAFLPSRPCLLETCRISSST
mmetsp:Transcript_20653/g.47377  ORF Transcript_20653/g.47377 Transcript_20653/m.47377 type:complete len:206 (-) Transcript_20653:336-953(-)